MDSQVSVIDELIESGAESRRAFAKEELSLEATELVSELMDKGNINKAELARLIGKSKSFVTQLLAGDRNMTMHTLADLTFVLGYRVELRATPLWKARSYDTERHFELPADALSRPAYQVSAPKQSFAAEPQKSRKPLAFVA